MANTREIETTSQIADQSPRKTARIAGLFYLIFILTTVLAMTIRGRNEAEKQSVGGS